MLVACVYKTGGDYSAEYVERLHDGVLTHAPEGTRFVCLTDDDKLLSCEQIPLEHNWLGWWSKMELFKLPGPVLYLDLDTVVTGDLLPLINHAKTSSLTLLSDFYRPERGQSGVMAWGGDMRWLYEKFKATAADVMKRYQAAQHWGDGAYIHHKNAKADRWQDAAPGMVTSRKVTHTRNANERVVCFHGQPRPHQVGWQV